MGHLVKMVKVSECVGVEYDVIEYEWGKPVKAKYTK